jgi:hypothetical protein
MRGSIVQYLDIRMRLNPSRYSSLASSSPMALDALDSAMRTTQPIRKCSSVQCSGYGVGCRQQQHTYHRTSMTWYLSGAAFFIRSEVTYDDKIWQTPYTSLVWSSLDSPCDHSIGVLLGLKRHPAGPRIVRVAQHEVAPCVSGHDTIRYDMMLCVAWSVFRCYVVWCDISCFAVMCENMSLILMHSNVMCKRKSDESHVVGRTGNHIMKSWTTEQV